MILRWKFFVLLPYEITLLSNCVGLAKKQLLVLLPYEITLLSNEQAVESVAREFYYLMKLHYSQTLVLYFDEVLMFYYLMKLHYSQT